MSAAPRGASVNSTEAAAAKFFYVAHFSLARFYCSGVINTPPHQHHQHHHPLAPCHPVPGSTRNSIYMSGWLKCSHLRISRRNIVNCPLRQPHSFLTNKLRHPLVSQQNSNQHSGLLGFFHDSPRKRGVSCLKRDFQTCVSAPAAAPLSCLVLSESAVSRFLLTKNYSASLFFYFLHNKRFELRGWNVAVMRCTVFHLFSPSSGSFAELLPPFIFSRVHNAVQKEFKFASKSNSNISFQQGNHVL